ncbi:MAG TPA: flagellar motor protein MotB [Xanthobacteraceae bacterium]|nr:flagellar motor protein MotB [Xanthobacteraceae bacterium]
MARRKEAGHGGGHGWFVTFADLMGLLVSFFVMLVAFSTQDQKKLQIVAGSMREAFGVQTEVRRSGVVEIEGLPSRPKPKNTTFKDDSRASASDDDRDRHSKYVSTLDEDRSFALATTSLRQSLQSMPELAELSSQVLFEQTPDGLNIELVDNDGRSMFPEGAKEPYERARHLIQKLAGQIKLLPYRITVTGHTSATRLPSRPGYGAWEMSADRANSVRQILEQEGVPTNNMFMVAGKADTAPLFPDDPYIAANRRITITLMRGQPPLPPGFKP